MIGIGLWDSKDITVKGLEQIRLCDYVYLESYTSKMGVSKEELEEFYGKQLIVANREMVEQKTDEILEQAKRQEVAFLVMGDVFAATTHTDLKLRAFVKGVKVNVIHNASVLTAIGETGLELYKFGKVTSIPFHHENIKSPVQVYDKNHNSGLHTLFLLDLDPTIDKYMTALEAAEFLLGKGVSDVKCVVCGGLGGEAEIVYCKLSDVSGKLKKLPQCLILPGELHFVEEEALKRIQA